MNEWIEMQCMIEWMNELAKEIKNAGMTGWNDITYERTIERTNEWMNEGCWNVKLHMITPLVATSAIKPMGIHEKGPVIVQPHMPT